jgi:GNAT superfamily N-acetyltransferase
MSIRGAEWQWSLIPPDQAKRLRPCLARIGDSLLTGLGSSDSLRMNRVIGLGHCGGTKEPMIDEIVAWYRDARIRRFSVLLGPGPDTQRLKRWLGKRGFRQHGGHALLLRDCRDPIPEAAAEVRPVRAGRRHAGAIVAIHAQCFGIPQSRRRWALAAAAASGVENHLGFVGRKAVAVGSLSIEGDLAWLGGGATLTRWRGRGAHAALIASRLRRAARSGCRWAWVETALPVAGRPSGSWRNLRRLGFEQVCVQPRFVWSRR